MITLEISIQFLHSSFEQSEALYELAMRLDKTDFPWELYEIFIFLPEALKV